MLLEWFVARRYLFSRERNALISVNTLISVLGVAVGVAALVVVIGVMDGAVRLMTRQITNIAPHVRLLPEPGDDGAGAKIDAALLARLRKLPGVERADAIYTKPAFIQLPRGSQAQKQGIVLFAMDQIARGGTVAFNLPADFKPLPLRAHELALGRPLAQKLGVGIGGLVQLLIQTPPGSASGQLFRMAPFRVAAIVDAGYYEFDSRTAFLNMREYQALFPGSGAEYVSIKLRDAAQSEDFKRALDLPGFYARTWQQENADFFQSLMWQKRGMFVILSLIILVSAFNIIGTLILMVKEKTREIGILQAVGAGHGFVGRLFLFIGVLIGLAGTGLGLALGVGIALLVPYAPLKLPEAIYNFDRLPMEIKPLTLVCIAAAALVICTAGALIPAWQAARLHPADAVRYD